MAKGISKELESEVRDLLGQLVYAKVPGTFLISSLGQGSLEFDAMLYLEDIGAFKRKGSAGFRITPYGREYWEKLNAPRWYWFRRNWFAALVAGATIVAASASAGPNIANLVV